METAQTLTRAQLLRRLQERLEAAGIEEAEEEANRILEDILEVTRTELFIDLGKEVPADSEKRSLEIVEGRERREPLAYLLGKADFWKEVLFVNEGCLIPRPETEFLVERVIEIFRDPNRAFSFLDIGTGSGAISVAILRAFPNAKATLLDVSERALEAARRNIGKYGLQSRARSLKSDLFGAVGEAEKFDLIVSNPPYLSEEDLLKVAPELKAEPRAALDGGKDGFDFYRRIIPAAKSHLKDGGFLGLEMGLGQAETVSKWLQDAGYDSIQRSKDYLGIERVLTARKK